VAKYWETPGFRALHREWTRELALSGFRDIERADGKEVHADTDASLDSVDPELEAATRSRAQDALSDEMVWRGMPKGARRMWALVVEGVPVRTAGRLQGVGQYRAEKWFIEVMRRIQG
jgi:hypothetical protein